MDTDVLIVGAGPTGLMLANQLASQGTRVRIIDRNHGPAQETRALGVQARTLEIYARMGIVERALALGKPAMGANVWSQGRHMAQVPLGPAGDGETPYPFILVLGQDDNERILGDRLREHGVTVQRDTELVALDQQPSQVVAWLKQPGGETRPVTAKWVAGCDGARSAVREMNKIPFPGAPYEHVFFVADVEMTGTMVENEVNLYLWRDGFHLFFPLRGTNHWRIVGILPPALRGRETVGFEDVVDSLRGEAGAGLSFSRCAWFSTYRIHHRSAARFREGRCFLLGDAAHIHSPVGAQGMNTGLQDAYNLGWKLALVAQGRAGAELLDSYEQERQPVARRLLNTTDRAFRLVVSDGPIAGLLRTQVVARAMAFAMRRAWLQKRAFGVVSQTRISYLHSDLSETLGDLMGSGPEAGDRFPWLTLRMREGAPVEDLFQRLDGKRFNLILIGQEADQPDQALALLPLIGMLQTHVILPGPANEAELRRARLPWPSFYLLRPDGHIGLCGGKFAGVELKRYLHDSLKLLDERQATDARIEDGVRAIG